KGPQPKGIKPKTIVVGNRNLEKYLGVQRFDFGRVEAENEIEREIAKIARKVVKEIALKGPQPKGIKPKTIVVGNRNLEKYLGVQRFDFGR
ncbi:endopeptidase La, partial [Klebsiella pneumoniae]